MAVADSRAIKPFLDNLTRSQSCRRQAQKRKIYSFSSRCQRFTQLLFWRWLTHVLLPILKIWWYTGIIQQWHTGIIQHVTLPIIKHWHRLMLKPCQFPDGDDDYKCLNKIDLQHVSLATDVDHEPLLEPFKYIAQKLQIKKHK